MGLLDSAHIHGISSAMHDVGIIRSNNLEKIATLVDLHFNSYLEKIANEGGVPSSQPSNEELAFISQSGLTEGDIQAAAKVIQVIAEMKQQSDQVGMGQQQQAIPGASQSDMPPQQQAMPIPPPPQQMMQGQNPEQQPLPPPPQPMMM